MAFRNLSPQAMFNAIAAEHRPRCRFGGDPGEGFAAWKERVLPEVLGTLGEFPAPVDPEPELQAEWEHGGLVKQKWLINVHEHLSATVLVNRPPSASAEDPAPAILCWHGHGPFGKEPVMGNDSSSDLRANIAQHNYDYGRQMAELGYVTYAIDWMGKGDRNDDSKPNSHNHTPLRRDWCDVYYLHATMLGTTPLAMNLAQARVATDFVRGLDAVDGDRLGVMGLSGGGTMALWTALADDRFAATEIICYSDLWAAFGIRDLNYCGSQVAPGLYALVDLPDLQGLLAPRPLLIDIGAYDTCFRSETALECYHQLEQIYRAAGAADNLELDLFPGEHGWGGRRSAEFFGNYLG